MGIGAATALAMQSAPVRLPVAALATDHGRPPHEAPADADRSPAPTTIEGAANIGSPPGHYGITGMRERIAEVGGRFSIGPACAAPTDAGGASDAPARGTLVEARVPARGL